MLSLSLTSLDQILSLIHLHVLPIYYTSKVYIHIQHIFSSFKKEEKNYIFYFQPQQLMQLPLTNRRIENKVVLHTALKKT